MLIDKFLLIISFLLYEIDQLECNVCHKGSSLSNCTSSNSKYVKLIKYNDFVLDSSFLLSSLDSNSNFKCFASCSTNDQCIFMIFKQKKCYFCTENIISFLTYNASANCLVYQKLKYLHINFIKIFY